MLAVNGRKENITGTESPYYRYNEIMIENWKMNAAEYVDAVYYISGNAEGLRQANEIQQDIRRSADGLIRPVIRIDLNRAADAVFSFHPEDQSF
ncbi:hypothetical protein N5D61_21995 [Pseudomonas sp. GD03842]|nr:hypothetical protein [Pseudomonas sp. GD03842]MDH0749006.1 hypothetical protein [Pseudomonas sp. GD03842]